MIEPFAGYQSVALLYLLLLSVGSKLSRGPVLTLATLSAALWNFLFVPPYFTFHVHKFHDGIMFVVFFVVAVAMGHLTSRLAPAARYSERQRERRTAALYELAQQAAFATDLETGLRAAVNLIESIFAAKAALLRAATRSHARDRCLMQPARFGSLGERERVWRDGRSAAACQPGGLPSRLPESEALHVPLQGRTAVMGVLSVRPPADQPFDPTEKRSAGSLRGADRSGARERPHHRSLPSARRSSKRRSTSGGRFCKAFLTS